IKLDKIVGGGQAIGTLADGRKVFVWGGLPGERVVIRLTKSKKSHAEGIVTEVIEPSTIRIQPRDPETYLSTSPWQIMEFAVEQQLKVDLVREAFALSHIPVDTLPNIMSDQRPYGYRNKMEYSLWWGGDNHNGHISLAFHIRGTHQKIPITQSSIEQPEIFAEAAAIVDRLNREGDEARRYQSLLVRADQRGRVSSALFEKHHPHPAMQSLTDNLLGHEYSYSPNGFFQINLPVYELALQEIMHYIKTDKVVDMYAGVGTIGLSVARDRQLTLVETDGNAFREMLGNVPTEIANIHPVHAKSEEALEHIVSDATIIVDPPRAGLHTAVLQRLLEARPPQIIYLSCNPVTQARDIAPLLEKYRIELMQPFNFFPRTPHIENLVVLNRI
ncbi:MAG: class I SAM-dependent RNA methyltransferase, partial [Sphaerimonospora mesophila]